MDIKPIKTEADYRQILLRIDTLVDSPDNSEQADELDVLSILVENYESTHYPIAPPDPSRCYPIQDGANGNVGSTDCGIAIYITKSRFSTAVTGSTQNYNPA